MTKLAIMQENKNEKVGENNKETNTENNAENNNDDIIKTLGINNISGNLNIVSNSKSSNNSEKLNPNIKINLDSKNIQLYLPDTFDTNIKKNNETINNDNNNNNNKISNLLNLFHLKGKIDIHNFNVKSSTRHQINFLDFIFAPNLCIYQQNWGLNLPRHIWSDVCLVPKCSIWGLSKSREQ